MQRLRQLGLLELTLAYELSHFGINNFSTFFLIAGIPQYPWSDDGENHGIMLEWGALWC